MRGWSFATLLLLAALLCRRSVRTIMYTFGWRCGRLAILFLHIIVRRCPAICIVLNDVVGVGVVLTLVFVVVVVVVVVVVATAATRAFGTSASNISFDRARCSGSTVDTSFVPDDNLNSNRLDVRRRSARVEHEIDTLETLSAGHRDVRIDVFHFCVCIRLLAAHALVSSHVRASLRDESRLGGCRGTAKCEAERYDERSAVELSKYRCVKRPCSERKVVKDA